MIGGLDGEDDVSRHGSFAEMTTSNSHLQVRLSFLVNYDITGLDYTTDRMGTPLLGFGADGNLLLMGHHHSVKEVGGPVVLEAN